MKPKFKPLRSGLERKVKDQLDEYIKKGKEITYEYESEQIEYRERVVRGICGKCNHEVVYQRRRYTPDFILSNGIRIEVKGRLTSQDRSKLLRIKDQYPALDLRIIFDANNRINKKVEFRYSNWAIKNGFRFSLKGEVPESWLK